jgi:hypothetical protein
MDSSGKPRRLLRLFLCAGPIRLGGFHTVGWLRICEKVLFFWRAKSPVSLVYGKFCQFTI